MLSGEKALKNTHYYYYYYYYYYVYLIKTLYLHLLLSSQLKICTSIVMELSCRRPTFPQRRFLSYLLNAAKIGNKHRLHKLSWLQTFRSVIPHSLYADIRFQRYRKLTFVLSPKHNVPGYTLLLKRSMQNNLC